MFCGRTRAIGEVLDRLRRKAAHGRSFLLILGASGSGKSSLAMAGVLPLLIKPGTIEGVSLWRRVVFRPGGQTEVGDLFDRLAAALVRRQQEGEGLLELISASTVEQLAADLRTDPKAAALLVRSALAQVAVLYREAEAQKLRGWMAESQAENRTADVERYGRLLADLTPREARLALVIDQAEELFTADDLNRRPELRKGFAVALDALAASGVVFVLVTLRSDFYSQIQQLPAFVDLKEADGQFDLLPAQPAEIAQMIRQPALAAGLRFEQDQQTQEGLDEVLADQVKAEPRLLPLLEFALDELYKQRSAGGLLTFEAYRVHLDGSIVRALAKRADATLAGLPEPSRDAFRSVMRRLATTVDDTAAGSAEGPPLEVIQKASNDPAFQRQRVPYDQLTAHPQGAKGLVDAFVAARLLVVETGKADEQKAEVTVAHEALFAHWAALTNLLLAERDDLILPRARVAASHERWRAENRAGDFLLPPGKQLSEAEQLLAEYGEELTPELKAYVAASMAQAHAQEKRRQQRLIGALLVFALLAVGTSAAAIFGFWQKGEAEKQTRLAVDAEQVANEQARIAESRRLAAESSSTLTKYPQRSLLLAVEAVKVGRSLQGVRVAEAEQALREALSIIGGRAIVLTQVAQDWGRSAVGISPDGHWCVTGGQDGTARLWDLEAKDPAASSVVLRGHEGAVSAVAIGRDNRWIVIGSSDRTARLWDLSAKDAAAGPVVLHGHESQVTAVGISPDNHLIVTGSWDGTARLWDLSAKDPATNPVVLRSHEGDVSVVAISPDNHWMVTGSLYKTARLWDLTAKDPTASPAILRGHEGPVDAVGISPDNHWLVTGSNDKTARLWDLTAKDPAANPVVLRGHELGVRAVAINRDSHWLVTGSEDKTARLWDLTVKDPAANPVILRGHEGAVLAVGIGPDGHWLVTGSGDGTARLWDLTTKDPGASPVVLRGYEGKVRPVGIINTVGINTVGISPDNHWLVTGSNDKTARLWDLSAKDPGVNPVVLRGHEGAVLAVGIGSDGHWLVTGSGDKTARLWDLTAKDPTANPVVLRGHKYWISVVGISPDNHWLVTGGGDETTRLWDLSAKDPAASPVALPGYEGKVRAVGISPDGHWLVTDSEDKTARLWDLTAKDPAANPVVLRGYEGDVRAVGISPDNHWLVTGNEDKTARLWDLTAKDPGANPVVLRGHELGVRAVAISRDSHWLVTGSEDKTARLWDLSAKDPAANPVVLRGHEDAVLAVGIGSDGHWLVTGSEDKTARLWDLTAKDPTANPVVLRGHELGIRAVAISRDSRWLVTGSRDGTARLWPLQVKDLVDLARITVGRNFTAEEWALYFPGEPYHKTFPDLPGP